MFLGRELRCNPSLHRWPSFGCPSASRNDLSLEINVTPTLVDTSWRIVLSSSTRCCRITSFVLGGILLTNTCVPHANLSVATCSRFSKCLVVASMLISLLQLFVPTQITILLYLFSVCAKLLATSFILAPGIDVTCVFTSFVWSIPLRTESPIRRSGFVV